MFVMFLFFPVRPQLLMAQPLVYPNHAFVFTLLSCVLVSLCFCRIRVCLSVPSVHLFCRFLSYGDVFPVQVFSRMLVVSFVYVTFCIACGRARPPLLHPAIGPDRKTMTPGLASLAVTRSRSQERRNTIALMQHHRVAIDFIDEYVHFFLFTAMLFIVCIDSRNERRQARRLTPALREGSSFRYLLEPERAGCLTPTELDSPLTRGKRST